MKHSNRKKPIFPHPPEKAFSDLQQEAEEKRFQEWKGILQTMPRCELVKVRNEVHDEFVSMNRHLFRDAVFVVKTTPDLGHHPTAYIFLYFLFHKDGRRVSMVYEGNIGEEPDVDDREALALFNAYRRLRRDRLARSWRRGYRRILKMIWWAYGFIPEPPRSQLTINL